MKYPAAHRLTTAQWMCVSTSAALAIVAVVFFLFPHGDKLGTALRYTARWSFLWFTLASTGSALTTLFGPRFEWLSQRARDFGLAFASAHTVHVSLVVRYLLEHPDYSRPTLLFFATGVAVMYLLAVLSVSSSLRTALTSRVGRVTRTVGVEYIGYIFISDFYGRTFHDGVAKMLIYLPFLVVSVTGPVLRMAARIKRWRLVASAGAHTLKHAA